MKIPNHLTIFHWECDWYNNFDIVIVFPSFCAGNISDGNTFYEEIDGIDVSFDTKIRLVKTCDYWSVGFSILGLGVIVGRQWSY